MKTVIALVLYVLSLCGIDNETRIDRIRSNGIDVLYSRVVARPNGTRFECLRSASGRCYYTVFPRQCATATGRPPVDCLSTPVARFALAKGDSRRMPSLAPSSLCVSADAAVKGPGCD
jgi:hypothetical protein